MEPNVMVWLLFSTSHLNVEEHTGQYAIAAPSDLASEMRMALPNDFIDKNAFQHKFEILLDFEQRITGLMDQYNLEKESVSEIMNNFQGDLEQKIFDAIRRVAVLNAETRRIEIRDSETIIFTLTIGTEKKIYLRYHLLDESPEHEASFSYFVSRLFVTNGVGTFENILKDSNFFLSNESDSISIPSMNLNLRYAVSM